jgi:hypothetical protein
MKDTKPALGFDLVSKIENAINKFKPLYKNASNEYIQLEIG